MTSPTPTPAGGGDLDDAAPPRKLYRSAEGRWLGGVAQGMAGHLALPVSWVRIIYLALTMASGLGVLVYGIFWFVVPLGTQPHPQRPVTPKERRRNRRAAQKGQVFALVVLLMGLIAFWDNVQFQIAGAYLVPLILIGIGAAVVWRQADDSRRSHWAAVTRRSRWLPLVRSAAGGLLVLVGVVGFVVAQGVSEDLSRVLQASLAVLVGIALLAGPYLVRVVQELSEERTMRIRAQERAEVAAHIHDSVLHTLTLIQRNAENPREVARLARAQERDLRSWLYKSAESTAASASPSSPSSASTSSSATGGGGEESDARPAGFAESVKATAAEVEDYHGSPIEVVCVGDCPVDESLAALLQAAREAMVNAAKYGGDGAPARVFAEVEGRTVFLSVRDRGPGFDLDAVPSDRMGVRESIIGRMQRHGGTARVKSTPGEGTEVELTMERAS
ncbi:ATP-binding protein [Streptomyces aidingensis]|uniref:Signal transduction histidine kinase n=1 Tax=Streptomyces aidingensis TaxID=910347 RepID=A0A1I1EGG1_9ACTN|nr:ATP-binding protein [Streptomyces aidingensis]SFB84438.1 Signal transduction histidine kinase [Streptomyces aidingensis]